MKFLADECVDRQIVDRLGQEGHEVLYVTEMKLGISDDEVQNLANREKSVLLTADKDFGELIFRQFQLKGGIGELDFGYTKLCEIAAIYIEKVNRC